MKSVLHIWQSGYPWEVRVGKINRALQAEGAQVTVLARRLAGEERESISDSVRVRRVGFERFSPLSLPVSGNPFWAREIESQIKKNKVDLVLVRDIPLALTAAKIARRHGIPVILDMAEHYPEAMRSWKKYSENPLLRKLVHDWRVPDWFETKVVPLMDGILVVCEEQRERLCREYGYPLEKICVVMNTPDLSSSTFDQKIRKSNTESKKCFGYFGILCQDRELETVLLGFDLAAKEDSSLELLISGGGESEVELRQIASSLQSSSQINFTGRYTPEQLGNLYSKADFGIVSLQQNKFTEHTLANKFFDYAALGKPFIFTDLVPLRNVMTRMNCGYGFLPGSPDSVAHAIKEIQKLDYAKLGQSGRNAIEREFNWKKDSEKMIRFLRMFQFS